MTAGERDAFDHRPSPDELLNRYRSESAGGRGRLRLYFGMAPGVGKTYRMLEEGHRRAERGTDVVVGFIEPHGRPLTQALLEGLEVVPRRSVTHRGITVEEMDPGAVIERHPTVALIDELAHTNVPGSPRAKRWEDVAAIQDAGIHVVSTLNVQHLESLADAVATITGAPVNERIPDALLASADEIELVDMSPHALRQRMRHGNVYPADRTRIALDRFFTEANLTALRELSLRVVARRVEDELDDVNQGIVPLVCERVLVVLDGSRAGGRAVRRAARLAGTLQAALVALAPGPEAVDALPYDRARNLREALDVAVDLGARVSHLRAGPSLEAIVEAAEQMGATHLFLPDAPTGPVERVVHGSLADRLARQLPEVDVHLVTAG
jgi:two-component system, OmpR family, sensor histidine kinase KdpD